jgi:hypothetical protein
MTRISEVVTTAGVFTVTGLTPDEQSIWEVVTVAADTGGASPTATPSEAVTKLPATTAMATRGTRIDNSSVG